LPDTQTVAGLADEALARALRESGLALSVSEAQTIAARLGRDPTIVEAHGFDAQWSEHCSYKSSRSYLRRLPTEGPTVMQGPQEDAGIVHLGTWQGKRYGVVIAHESHNHPSQVVPFEGAATGVGGIVRDVLCMGARVIALADPLRFGPRDDPHARYVAQGVVDGIAAYGNAIGVPTIAGDVYFHPGFRDNCLVNVVALGLLTEDEIIHSVAPPGSAGWDVVLVGKATDRSGFGGAAFSSLVLDEADAEANKSAVQVPDPFLKSVVMRASYRVFDELRRIGLTVGFKDLGAGGIMGCTAELAAGGGFGARIDLDRCPAAQPNLPSAVLAVGETQERLTWIVPPSFTPRLLEIYNDEFTLPLVARGAQAAVIGTITSETDYVLERGGREVMRVPIDFLTGGIRYERAFELPVPSGAPLGGAEARGPELATFGAEATLGTLLRRVLAHRDVCSRRPIFERYDSVVRGTTSLPCGYADAGVIVPIPGAPLGVALAVDGNPRYALVDPGLAAEHAVYESVRNVLAVGARPAGLTDCLNFGNPEIPTQMGEFVAAVDGIARAGRELGVPFVSGNVSLYNQSAGGASIPPSPIIACVGTLADVSRSVTAAFKTPGAPVFRLGAFSARLGGSVLAELGAIEDALPAIDYAAVRAGHAAVLEAIESGAAAAVHDVSDGGTFVALAEMAFAAREAAGPAGAGGLPGAGTEGATFGFRVERRFEPAEAFGEAGAFVVEARDEARLREICARHGAAPIELGRVTEDGTFGLPGEDVPLDDLYETWSAPLRDFYDEVPQA
jgi:phosphoribosylformylglycinamidine synthase